MRGPVKTGPLLLESGMRMWELSGVRPVLMLIAMTLPLLIVLQWVGPRHLGLDDATLRQGEWWRLWTGHFVHLGYTHLILNAAGFAMMALLFEHELTFRRWIALLAFLPPLLSMAILFGCPWVSRYAGLSGVLHGCFAAGALTALGNPREKMWGGGLLLALALKLMGEVMFTDRGLTSAWIGGAVLMESHRYGSLLGLAAGTVFLQEERRATKGLP